MKWGRGRAGLGRWWRHLRFSAPTRYSQTVNGWGVAARSHLLGRETTALGWGAAQGPCSWLSCYLMPDSALSQSQTLVGAQRGLLM